MARRHRVLSPVCSHSGCKVAGDDRLPGYCSHLREEDSGQEEALSALEPRRPLGTDSYTEVRRLRRRRPVSGDTLPPPLPSLSLLERWGAHGGLQFGPL